jgi:GTPase SAR1 family protein
MTTRPPNYPSSNSFLDDDDDHEYLSPEKVDNIRMVVHENNKHVLESAMTRNVLILGKSRSGKSTMIGVLKDPTYAAEQLSLFANKEGPQFQAFSLRDIEDETLRYNLNIIDTPGLQEQGQMGNEEKRNDEAILKSIMFCLKNEVTKIHMLVVCVSAFQGVSNSDAEAFEAYIKQFYHENIPIVLCISRAESKTESEKQKLAEEFKSHAFFGQLLKKDNVCVQFMGCVDENTAYHAFSEKELQRLYRNVYKMRNTMLQSIFEAKESVSMLELPGSEDQRKNASLLVDEQLVRLSQLQECKDFDLQSTKVLARDVMKGMDALREADVQILFAKDEDVISKLRLVLKMHSEVSSRMPPRMKELFLQGRVSEIQ